MDVLQQVYVSNGVFHQNLPNGLNVIIDFGENALFSDQMFN